MIEYDLAARAEGGLGSSERRDARGPSHGAGCTLFLADHGHPSATDSEPFIVRASDIENGESGPFAHGFDGRASDALQRGPRRVADRARRLPIQDSGGSFRVSGGSGVFTFAFDAHIQAGMDTMLAPRVSVNVQSSRLDLCEPSNTGPCIGSEFAVCR